MGTGTLGSWTDDHALSLNAAADALGLWRRMIAHYRTGSPVDSPRCGARLQRVERAMEEARSVRISGMTFLRILIPL